MRTRTTRNTLLAGALTLVIGGGATGTLHLAQAETAAATTSVVPVEPYRILDTRNGIGIPSTDPVGPGETIDLQVAGVGPVPTEVVGVVLNVTGTSTTEATYITAWPTGTTQPTASVLNLTPGIDAPNGVTALLGAGGQLSLFNFTGNTHLIADVAAYLVTAGSSGGGPTGPQGPAGVATAWGQISGLNNPPTIVASSTNVSAVVRSLDHTGYGSAGSYCVLFDPPIPAERIRATVVTAYYGSNYPVAVNSTETYCNEGELGVLLFDFATTGTTEAGDFNFLVP